MSWTIPPLNPLRAFEAAGRLGSFTRAAEELNVSHSAISRHVRGLEARLNSRLFRAKSTGVELTETGRAYFDKISPAFEAISLATEALTVPPSGVVTLTTENTVAQSWIIPRLASLKARHPDISLQISISTDLMDIEAHEFDLGLRYLRHDPPQGYARLFTCLVSAFAAPASVKRSGDQVDLNALATSALIQEATFQLWDEWFELSGMSPAPKLELPHPLNARLAIQSAIAGLGTVLMDRHLCEPEVQSGVLERLNDVEIPFGGYYVAMNAQASRRKAVRAVYKWLLEQDAD
ncbi:MAG: LysR family transcriptional regulator [Boseongicola sp.]|nr:LysR family transcriptional regulator [Boseongicola sp.]